MYAATHANETGVRRYEYWRGADEDSYYALLAFDDYQAFLTHQASPHHEAQSAAFGEVLESVQLEWVDPVAAAAPLGPTESQRPAADASDLMIRYSKTHKAAIPDWWHGAT